MQIHELNTFSGTPSSSDYLIIDNGTDTAKITPQNLVRPVVDAYGDTSWQTLVDGVNYRKKLGFVTVSVFLPSQSLSSSWLAIGTLPSGYAPSRNMLFAGTSVTNSTNIIGIVNTSGEIQLRLPTGATAGPYSVEATVTYIL